MSEEEKYIKCKNCHQNILESKIFLHEGFCLRNNKLCPECDKVFLIQEYEEHLKSHNQCEKCGAEFETKEDLKDHMKIPHIIRNINCHNKQQEMNNSENNNINEGINDSKVKCTECDLIFDSVESMSANYYEIHEKERIINNNKKLEELNKQEEKMYILRRAEEVRRKISLIKKALGDYYEMQ